MKWRTEHYGTFRRYPLIPTNRWFNVFLHVYYSKRKLAFHDHPWWNFTIILWGERFEEIIPKYMTLDRGKKRDVSHERFLFRRATTAHAMQMRSKRLVTLFITGREWNVVGGRA